MNNTSYIHQEYLLLIKSHGQIELKRELDQLLFIVCLVYVTDANDIKFSIFQINCCRMLRVIKIKMYKDRSSFKSRTNFPELMQYTLYYQSISNQSQIKTHRCIVWGSLIVKLSGDGARVTRPSANQIAHLRAH